jgi:hypothetical protein
MRYVGHVARPGDRRGAYRVLVGRPEGMIKTGKPGRIWDDNIKMNPQELGQGSKGWDYLPQDRNICWAVVNEVMNFLFHKMRKVPWLKEESFAS